MRILSLPTGQELAPWQLHQVAVASQGLSPQPLWISAALRQRGKINKRGQKSQEKRTLEQSRILNVDLEIRALLRLACWREMRKFALKERFQSREMAFSPC